MTTVGKLGIGAAVIVCATGYMAYLGAASSWQYYVTVDECLGGGETLASARLRVNGKVAAGSLSIAADRRQANLSLEGSGARLPVVCNCSIPDNLQEAADVVVEGAMDGSGTFHADKVLTRCASKYESKQPAAASGGMSVTQEERS